MHSQPERDVDMYKEMQIQAIQKMEHQLKKQVSVEIVAKTQSDFIFNATEIAKNDSYRIRSGNPDCKK